MSLPQTFLATLAFAAILVGLGAVDAVFTKATLWIPSRETSARQGVAKRQGPDVEERARARGFAIEQGTDDFLLQRVMPASQTIVARTLLTDNDRAAAIAWIDTAQVKNIFTRLRALLRSGFSPGLRDLIDETQTQPGKPPRDVLSFVDPAVHENRVLIVRVRERLYELHVVSGHEREIDALIDTLTE